MTIRPFEDLIKPIEIDGETFVPIEEIAKLAFYYVDSQNVILNEADIYHNEITCYFKIESYTENFIVTINPKFDVHITYLIDTEKMKTHNQVQIVKNLIKWGFIEP